MWLVLIKPVDLTGLIQSESIETCLAYRKNWEGEGKCRYPRSRTQSLIALGYRRIQMYYIIAENSH